MDQKKHNPLDSIETTLDHEKIIEKKKILNSIYHYFYKILFQHINQKEKILELGSGSSIFKKINSNLITSDIIKTSKIDIAIDAHELKKLGSNFCDTIIMCNVLHHLHSPDIFFSEASQILNDGGKIVMIEPYISPLSYFIYKFLHHEPCYKSESWNLINYQGGRLSESNLYMPTMIFYRDHNLFEKKFPQFKIAQKKPILGLSYLLSGGLSGPSFIPDFLVNFFMFLEIKVLPQRIFGLFTYIEIKKV